MILNFLVYFFVFVFGLCVGSFLNCVIYRLEKKKKMTARSFCPKCKKQLKWYDLIPVLSFFVLGGKCRYCEKKISWQYPVVEISTALIFLLIFNFKFLILKQFLILNFINLTFLYYIASVLIIIFIYDLKHYVIPDKILFPAIGITLFYRLFENFINWGLIENWPLKIENFIPVGNYFLAALIASGFFLVIFLISGGKWLGFGDVKLAVLLGLLLGWPNILVGLFLSFFFGAIISIGLMVFYGKNLKSQIPFAPFLIIGTFVAMFWGEELVDWYLHIFT